MKYLFKNIIELLKQKESLALATVVRQQGSTPGKAGARMLVRRDGETVGTVGGGALEAAVCEAARTLIEQRKTRCLSFNLNDLGMICGGQVEVVVDYIDAAQKFNLEVFDSLLQYLNKGQRVWLVDFLPNGEEGPGGICLLDSQGRFYGQARVTEPALGYELMKIDQFTFLDDQSLVVEPMGATAAALLFGAGHIARSLVPLLNMVGFFTSVMDERKEYANWERFPDADRLLVCSYDRALQQFNFDEQDYVVIITHSHKHDQEVLAQALKTRAAYVGMIASQTKRERIFRALLDQGFSPEGLKRVHSPIGLAIGAQTPEEIAISICAEMIKVRAGRLTKGKSGY